MFETTSRYFTVADASLAVTEPDGNVRTIPYKRRRFLPPSAGLTTLVEHTFAAGERLDGVTARYLGDPTQFWRICDANDVFRPDELETSGRVIEIAMATPAAT